MNSQQPTNKNADAKKYNVKTYMFQQGFVSCVGVNIWWLIARYTSAKLQDKLLN